MESTDVVLHRTMTNVLFFGLGSSVMRVRPESQKNWRIYMRPSNLGRAFHCKTCDALLMLPYSESD